MQKQIPRQNEIFNLITVTLNKKDHGVSKRAGPVAIATFATIVNPALVRAANPSFSLWAGNPRQATGHR